MADTNDRVMAMVQEELGKNPNISATELQEKAQKIDGSMGELTTRQFHARYPLQVKRAQAAKKGGGKGGGRKRAAKKAAKKAPRKAAKKTAGAKRGGRRGATKAAPAARAGGGRGSRGGEDVKAVLVDFAGKIAGADTATLVRVMGDLDRWVERVRKAAG